MLVDCKFRMISKYNKSVKSVNISYSTCKIRKIDAYSGKYYTFSKSKSTELYNERRSIVAQEVPLKTKNLREILYFCEGFPNCSI